MGEVVIQGLAGNAALLAVLCFVYVQVIKQWESNSLAARLTNGLLFGLVTIGVMLSPLHLYPGVVFDTRSVVISLAGFFAGPVPAAIALAMGGALRIWEGGTGAFTGVLVLVASAFLGVVFHYWRKRRPEVIKPLALYGFGLAVHLVMLLCMLTLPWPLAWQVLQKISLPVIIVYPAVSLLLSLLLLDRESKIAMVQALTESEQKYRAVVDDLPVLICSHLQSGEVIFANTAYCDYFGKTSKELIGTNFLSLIPEEDHETVMGNIAGLTVDSPMQAHEHRVIAADGRIRWQRWTNRVLFNQDGQVRLYQSFGEDVTERRQAQQQLRESRDRLKVFFEQGAEAVYVADLDGRLLQVNEQACRSTGYTKDEMLIMNMIDIDAEKANSEALAAFVKTLSPKQPVMLESKHRRKDGSVFPVEVTLALLETSEGLRIMGIAHDVTKRLEQQAQYGAILRTTKDGFWLMDKNGKLLEVNAAAAAMLGYTNQEMTGLNVNEIETEQGPDDDQEHLLQVIEDDYDIFETRHRRKDGSIIDVEVSASRLPFSEGRFVAFTRDITNRKQAEQGREITLQLLNHLNQNEGLREIMSQVTLLMRQWSGCEAVGVRLRDGDDFTYFETHGFPPEFVRAEDSLCSVDSQGSVLLDDLGNPILECMCGNVIRGRFDPNLPFFTEYGSFWTNSTTDLLALNTEEYRQARTRNRCNIEGYDSVALIPIRYGAESFGLLQFNDSRLDCFDERLINLFETLAANLALCLAQRQSAEALSKSEVLFRQVFNNMGSGVAIYEPVNGGEDFVFKDINQAGLGFVNRVKAEVVGKRVSDVFPGVVELGLFDVFKRVYQTGQPEHHPSSVYQDYELTMWVENYVCKLPTGEVVAIYEDTTARKQAEAALAQSEGRLKLALDSVSDAIWDWQVNTGNVYLSARWYTMLGFAPYELPQEFETWRSLLHPEDLPSAQQIIKEHLESGETFEVEYRMRTKGDQWRWVLARGKAVEWDDGGDALRMLGTHVDITERKSAEADRQRLQAQLQQAQKMDALGTLAGGIAHDFNNILAAILGYSELIQEDLSEGDPIRQDIAQITKSAGRAKELVRQILTFSRIEEAEHRPLYLNNSVTEAAAMLERTIPKMISLELQLDPEINQVRATPRQVEQIILNLTSNAADSITGSGNITITTNNVTLETRTCDACGKYFGGECVRLSIKDNGSGMSPEVRDKIFDPFYTTKDIGKGTGLGLSTVYGIVSSLGAHINCQSQLEVGTDFSVYFPFAELEQMETQRQELKQEETLRGKETILVVDDEAAVRDIASKILTRNGYKVLLADSGEGALAIYEQNHSDIDAVVMDLGMPGMGGKACLSEMRRLYPDSKVLIASGYIQYELTDELEALGAAGMIAKPYRTTELLRRLREGFNGSFS